MIEQILPPAAVPVESFGDPDDAVLLPEEEPVVAKAVDKRRREFTTVRHCARQALATLGHPPTPILPGERGAPIWPDGVVGTMTHCAGYRAAALAHAGDLISIGIDAEPHEPLPNGVLDAVSLPQERERLTRLTADHPGVHWDKLLFAAKEATYKTWFPLTGKWLGFEEADIDTRADGTFTVTLLVPGPVVDGKEIGVFEGRWIADRGLVAAAIALEPG